jgi:hypothetical protein
MYIKNPTGIINIIEDKVEVEIKFQNSEIRNLEIRILEKVSFPFGFGSPILHYNSCVQDRNDCAKLISYIFLTLFTSCITKNQNR